MSRITPFELVFRPLVAELEMLRHAVDRAGPEAREWRRFGTLPDVQRLLERLVPASAPDTTGEYLALLFVAFRYWAAGERLVTTPRRRLEPVLAQPVPAGPPEVPGGACYVQLPTHWFWGQATPDSPHEPLDGFFVVPSADRRETTLVAVLGLRAERGGFTQVTMQSGADDFTAARAERRLPAFAPVMEGGAAAGFRSVATGAELLTLARLACLAAGE